MTHSMKKSFLKGNGDRESTLTTGVKEGFREKVTV